MSARERRIRRAIFTLLEVGAEGEELRADAKKARRALLDRVVKTVEEHVSLHERESLLPSVGHLVAPLAAVYSHFRAGKLVGKAYEMAAKRVFERQGYVLTPDGLDDVVLDQSDIVAARGAKMAAQLAIGKVFDLSQRSMAKYEKLKPSPVTLGTRRNEAAAYAADLLTLLPRAEMHKINRKVSWVRFRWDVIGYERLADS